MRTIRLVTLLGALCAAALPARGETPAASLPASNTPASMTPAAIPPAADAPAASAPAADAPSATSTAPGPTPREARLAALTNSSLETDKCLVCHDKDAGEIKLESGEMLSLAIDPEAMAHSAHGRKVVCSDCHQDLLDTEIPHAKLRLASRRDFAIQYSEGCKKCHASNYTETLDSVHRAQIAKGKRTAAVCSDCHGAHDITPAAEPRSRIARTCAACHEKVSTAYVGSVHGKALSQGNEDVPTCTDCHRSHAIADPRTGAWRLKSPEVCGNCHGNEKLMTKYKLSTNVLQSYLSDFHGTTVKMQLGEDGAKPVVALCTDCHGVHDITKVKDPNSRVIKENLLVTCKKCHADAKADFPASWLSHYEPSLTKAPLVFLIKAAYWFFIPFMIGGLALQIVLHLWRMVVNR
jgi:nitrate/TMAO reductase-like tetraheme cytochrome c subunit